MMFWNVYLRRGVVLVPTVARTKGPFIEIEPVEIAVATDRDAVHGAILRMMERGNPKVPTPTRGAFPKPVLLRYAGVKSWSTFEATARTWSIEIRDGVYRIQRCRRAADRGFEPDPEHGIVLPGETEPTRVAETVTELVMQANAEPPTLT